MLRAIALLAATSVGACSFHGPLARDAAGADAFDATVVDGQPGPDAPLSCLQKWQQHVVTLGPEVALTAVNSGVKDRDVFVTLDETQLYFTRANPDDDVFLSTRSGSTATLGAPVLTSLASPDEEGKLSLTEDGLIAAVSATEFPSAQFDVVLYQRTAPDAFTRKGLVAVAATSDHHDYDPYITPDGLRLYWAPATVGLNDQHIALASRASTTVVFEADHVLTELGSPASDPAPSYDETVLLYSRQTDGGSIHYATRPTATGAFTPAGLVPTINTLTGNEADPHLSKDACRVYFARYSPTTDWDLYVAPVL